MGKSALAVLSVLVLSLLFTVALFARSITGDLVVNVSDPSGAAVSTTKLNLIQVATNAKFEGQRDSLGNA